MKQLLCMLISALAIPALGQVAPKEQCSLAVVEWQDACVYTKAMGIDMPYIDELTVAVKSIGCVRAMEKSVLVIFHFVGEKPDTYLAIPRQWVLKITPLSTKEPITSAKKE